MYNIKHTQKLKILKGWNKYEINIININWTTWFFVLTKILISFIFENLGLTLCDTVIQSSGPMVNLFWYLVSMAVVAEKDISQRYTDSNARNAPLAVLTKSWYYFVNHIHHLHKDFCWNLHSKFPFSLMSISCSCKLITTFWIFISLTNEFITHRNS